MTSIVRTNQGSVRGFVGKNLDDEKFYGFLGIPFAKPPLGNLRFKAPQPPEPWTGIRDATKEGPKNFQRDPWYQQVGGSEDSLHLNIFTREVSPKGSLKPVMVWIHGGGFVHGSNSTTMFGPEYLLTEDVVLVLINYRLGLLGFIRAEDPSLEIFGNAGLKDQVAALKWVQANIQQFGGDPNNVTAFGESAGACSALYLVLSKAARGLVHKSIAQSGVVTMGEGWGLPQPNIKELLKTVGKGEMSETEALNYLRNLPIEELYAIQEFYLKTTLTSVIAPTAEKPNPTAFFTEEPRTSLVKGNFNQVPMIVGYNSNECNFLAKEKFNALIKKDKFTTENVVASTLNLSEDHDEYKNFCNRFKNAYENEGVSKFQFISDAAFIAGNVLFTRNYSKKSRSPIYLYKMSLDAGLNFTKRAFNLQEPGAAHADDIGYLFKTPFPLEKGKPEETYVRNFVKLWTNFAKYGNPTPANNDLGIVWKPYTIKNENFLDIDKVLIPGTSPDNERMQIWNELFEASKTAGFLSR